MNIYYQWDPGSYSHLASREVKLWLSDTIEEIVGVSDFDTVWKMVTEWNVGVLPIENSYAWSIHQNVYNFLSFSHKIIWEHDFEVQHCLLSLEKDISEVETAYSHHQALSQTYKYLKKKGIKSMPYSDTAGAAKMLVEKQKFKSAAIASELAADLYNLNILDRWIQDQEWNTTKFLIIVGWTNISTTFHRKKRKITILFSTSHIPGSLYKCLGTLANRDINITKIESIPRQMGRFSYSFWLTFEWSMDEKKVQEALGDIEGITSDLRILWEY